MSIKAKAQVIVHFISSEKVATMSMGLFGFQATLRKNSQIKSKKQQNCSQFAQPISLYDQQSRKTQDISALSAMNEQQQKSIKPRKSNIAGSSQDNVWSKIRSSEIRGYTYRTCIHKIIDEHNNTDMSNDIVKFVDEIQIFPKNEFKNKQLTYCLQITSLLLYRNKIKLLDDDNSFKNEEDSKKIDNQKKRQIFKETQERIIKASKIQQGFICYDQIDFNDNLICGKIVVLGYVTGYYFKNVNMLLQPEKQKSTISKSFSNTHTKRQDSQKKLNNMAELLQWIGNNYKIRQRKETLTQYIYRKYVKKQKSSLITLQNKFIKGIVSKQQWKYVLYNTKSLPAHFESYMQMQKDLASRKSNNHEAKQQAIQVKQIETFEEQNFKSQMQQSFCVKKQSGSMYEQFLSKELEKSFDYYISFYKPKKLDYSELAEQIQSISKDIDKFINCELLDLILQKKAIHGNQIVKPTYLKKPKNKSILYQIFYKNNYKTFNNYVITQKKINQLIVRDSKEMLKLQKKLKIQKNYEKKASVTLQSILFSEISGNNDDQQFPLIEKNNQNGRSFIFCEIEDIQHFQQSKNIGIQKEKKILQTKNEEVEMINYCERPNEQQEQQKLIKNQQQKQSRQQLKNFMTFNPQIKSNQSQFSHEIKLDKKIAEERMLIVFCHGFQANGNNMVTIVSGFQKLFPKAHFLVSTVNQQKTEDSIESMGNQLSQQIQAYIEYYLKGKIKRKDIILNLVGHSMGGIIARAAIPYLQMNYPNQFGFYCSFSSPHLGCCNAGDKLVKMGMWMMEKFHPTISLNQLLMNDRLQQIAQTHHDMHKNYSQPQIHHIKPDSNSKGSKGKQAKLLQLKKAFLFQLSTDGSLKIFQKVILLSSADDSYVPWHSARILHLNSKQTSPQSIIQKKMIENLLGCENQSFYTNKIRQVVRVQIDFDLKNDKKTNKLDKIIGRGAHIKFLTDTEIMKTIKYTLPQIFDLYQQNKP